jgi:hypothetical protein
MSRLRPILRRTAFSLTCGLLLSLASAWLAAAFSTISSSTLHNLNPGDTVPTYIGTPSDWRLRTWHEVRGIGLRYDLVSENQWMGSKLSYDVHSSNRTMLRVTTGWPWPAMQWAAMPDSALPAGAANSPWYAGVELPGKGVIPPGLNRRLPLRPIVVPFVLNTSVFSVVALVLFAGASGLRRAIRRRRAQCPACGYLVENLPKCPECGLATSTSPARDPQSPTPSPAHPPASAP